MNKHEYEFKQYLSPIEVIEFTNWKEKKTAYKTEIAGAFERYWWSFVHALWIALYHADRNNSKKLIETWSNYVEDYFNTFILTKENEIS